MIGPTCEVLFIIVKLRNRAEYFTQYELSELSHNTTKKCMGIIFGVLFTILEWCVLVCDVQ